MTDLTVVILTFNEEIHIRRAISSVLNIAKEVILVDSYSTDTTTSIAIEMGARVLQNPFVNQAQQFQWALDQGYIKTSWTMRLDADEYLTPQLIQELSLRLPTMSEEVSGIILKRRVYFMGQWIRHGGYYPIHLLRIWRTGHAAIEQRWMDEHMILTQGASVIFNHDFVDENLNNLTWWTAKHNDYATREAIDILSRKHQFHHADQHDGMSINLGKAEKKRWYKDNLYLRMPLFLRAFLYFQFRFWIRLGILDGKRGLVWHFLQGFWYRFLVDAKVMQIERWATQEKKTILQVLQERYKVGT